MKRLIVTVTCGALAGFALSANAALIGYWNAANPGASPGTQWDDLSGNGHHLASVDTGSGAPVHNSGSGSYTLNQANGFVGTGPSSDFDFDNSAGGSSADPYTFNVYMKWAGPNSGDVPYTIMTKAGGPGDQVQRPQVQHGHYTGHAFSLSWDQPDSLQLIQQTGNNSLRTGARRGDAGDGVGSLKDQDVMMTVTHDGTGTGGGLALYANGIELTASKFGQGNINGSTLNGGALQIGTNDDTGGLTQTNNGFAGDLYFVEIYDTALTGEEVLNRFNSIPEPTTLALLGIGGGLLWWRRRIS